MGLAIFYVDESGDQGWTFTAPYRHGGSSRYLTIATLICPSEKKHFPKRLMKHLYKHFEWDPAIEKKWSNMTGPEREWFAKQARDMVEKQPDIKFLAITVFKEKVTGHMRKDGNKLYNYMMKLSLIEEMCKYDKVLLVPDARSVKVGSGNSLHDYLSINLTYEQRVETELQTQFCDSSCTPNLQFTDMLAGLVHHHYEDSHSKCWNMLRGYITSKPLFFWP